MYLDHFGFDALPFSLAPTTAFVFSSRAHQEALNTLLVALEGGEGFVKITGEVGTGKTLLCRRLLDVLAAQGARTAYIPNPAMQARTLLLSVADELGLRLASNTSEHRLHRSLADALFQLANEDKRLVICLDEAQALPTATLEAIRLLSNLETERRKLVQIVLFGQPELDHKLSQHTLRPLRQRIAFQYDLRGMSRAETADYLQHRVRAAGGAADALFTFAAVSRMHSATRGVPRLVNVLAHKSLMAAFGQGEQGVDKRHVAAAVADTPQARQAMLAMHMAWPLRWLGGRRH